MPQTTLSLVTSTPHDACSAGELSPLVQAVAAGDREALAELYRRVGARIHAFAASRLRDGDAAGDVVHEVMLRVWRGAASFRGRSRPLTWILGIAHHVILDHLKRRRPGDDPPAETERVDVETPDPSERAIDGERRAAVQDALAGLGDAHRQVVHLAFYEDLSYPEIAELLDIPPGTVKTRMLHAKKKLARRLGWRLGDPR